MRCKKCDRVTKHRYSGPGTEACEVCGTERQSRQVEWGFPQLTEDENEVIREARGWGFAAFYPAYPNAEAQARNTLAGAREWLRTHPIGELLR